MAGGASHSQEGTSRLAWHHLFTKDRSDRDIVEIAPARTPSGVALVLVFDRWARIRNRLSAMKKRVATSLPHVTPCKERWLAPFFQPARFDD